MKGQAAQHQRFRGIVTLALIGVLTFVLGSSEALAQKTEYVTWTFVQGGQVFTGIAVKTGSVTVTNAAGQSVTVAAGQFTITSATTPPSPPVSTATAPPDVQQQIQKGEVKTNPLLVGDVKVKLVTDEPTAATELPPGQQVGGPPCTPVVGSTVVGVTVVSPAGEPILGTGIIGCR